MDYLNGQLLSAKASYLQLQQESSASHQSEVSALKRLHREEVQRLTAKLELELTKSQTQVRSIIIMGSLGTGRAGPCRQWLGPCGARICNGWFMVLKLKVDL